MNVNFDEARRAILGICKTQIKNIKLIIKVQSKHKILGLEICFMQFS